MQKISPVRYCLVEVLQFAETFDGETNEKEGTVLKIRRRIINGQENASDYGKKEYLRLKEIPKSFNTIQKKMARLIRTSKEHDRST